MEKKNFRIPIANNYSKKCFDQVLNIHYAIYCILSCITYMHVKNIRFPHYVLFSILIYMHNNFQLLTVRKMLAL